MFFDIHASAEKLRQWKIYLQVILEKRPNHEKADEWKETLRILATKA